MIIYTSALLTGSCISLYLIYTSKDLNKLSDNSFKWTIFSLTAIIVALTAYFYCGEAGPCVYISH